jgi:hypothetical protein
MATVDTGFAYAKYPVMQGTFIDNSVDYIISSIAVYADGRYAEIGISRGVPYRQADRTQNGLYRFVKGRNVKQRIDEEDLLLCWDFVVQALMCEFDSTIDRRVRSRSWYDNRHAWNYFELYPGYYFTVNKRDADLLRIFTAHCDMAMWEMYVSGYVFAVKEIIGKYKRIDYSKKQLARLKGVQILLDSLPNVQDNRFAFAIYSQIKERKPLLDLILDSFPEKFPWTYEQLLDGQAGWKQLKETVKQFPIPRPYCVRVLPSRDTKRKFHARECVRFEVLQVNKISRGVYKQRTDSLPKRSTS